MRTSLSSIDGLTPPFFIISDLYLSHEDQVIQIQLGVMVRQDLQSFHFRTSPLLYISYG